MLIAEKHPESSASLNRWTAVAEKSLWKKTADVRATFRTADFVGGKVVFNIGGNHYRLISTIDFKAAQVDVNAVLTHKEYDKAKWKQ
jgi:mRNA interferase HigB